MRFSVFSLLLLLLTCVCLTLAQGSYEDCCLKYVKEVKPAVRRRVVSYKKQETDGGCNIPAVLFTLKKGKQICADPKQHWVRKLIKIINMRKGGRWLWKGQ